MELRNLRSFVVLAEELSFRRAAARLHLAQPALSTQIKNLEAELGVALFERTTRRVRLTDGGHALLENARAVLAAADLTKQTAQKAGAGTVGNLRIGFVGMLIPAPLAERLAGFRRQFPEVQVLLHDLLSERQIHQLRTDQIDIGFLRPTVPILDMESQFVEALPATIALPATHRLARSRRLRWGDLDGEPIVLLNPMVEDGIYNAFWEHCAKNRVKPHVGQYASSFSGVLWLVAAGFGIAPLSRPTQLPEGLGVVFREAPAGLPPVKTLMVWRKHLRSPVVQNFVKYFQTA